MIFYTHNAEVVDRYIMTGVVMMIMEGLWGYHVFFVCFSKSSA